MARVAPTVRLARAADIDELAQVLGRAFDDDPVMNHVITARPVAPRAALLLGTIAKVHLDDGAVYVAEDPSTGAILGGAIWAPPDRWKTPLLAYVKHLPSVLRAVGLRGIPKISVLDAIEREHPTAPHYYLAVIGTDPAQQGRGVGGALVAPILERCDTEGLPAYLESSKESNVGYYARFRFEVTKPFTLKGGPPLWFMWRS